MKVFEKKSSDKSSLFIFTSKVNDNIVILGDLNSDLFIANNNKLIETMMLFNLVNIISKPTRITIIFKINEKSTA
jgi:hypothetical protein